MIKQLTKKELVKIIEHTNLNPNATKKDIETLCQEAIDCNFGAVCVRYDKVWVAKNYLDKKNTKVISTIGFPEKKYNNFYEMIKELKKYTAEQKFFETTKAIEYGADEIDMIIKMNHFKANNYYLVDKDINSIVKSVKNIPIKVILETCYLNDKEIENACKIAEGAGASFVKTSTGFGKEGATINALEIMSKAVSNYIGIKAAGGIKDLKAAQKMYQAANKYKNHPFRIGASSLVTEFKKTNKKQNPY